MYLENVRYLDNFGIFKKNLQLFLAVFQLFLCIFLTKYSVLSLYATIAIIQLSGFPLE